MVTDLYNYNYEKGDRFLFLLIAFVAIVLFNILQVANPFNLVLTIPQYIIVLGYLFSKKINNAALLHFCFIILSLSAQSTSGMVEAEDYSMYNYGTLKLLGPVRVCYVVNILLVLSCLSSKLKLHRHLLFNKLYKTFCILGITAALIGAGGLLLNQYYRFDAFLGNSVYMFVVLSTSYVLLCLADKKMIKSCYYISLSAVMAGILASFLSYTLFGIFDTYSIFDTVYCADSMVFASILVAGLVFIKEKKILYITLAAYLFILAVIIGGKGVFRLAFALGCLAYFVFIDKNINNQYKRQVWILRPLIILAAIVLISNYTINTETMAYYKLESALSMFSGSLGEVASSPYVRISSLLNILNDGLHNPFTLFFGNGYGGYFEDRLGLFNHLDLTQGAWSAEVVASGKFPSGHDTMVSLPLFNGLFGAYLVIRMVFLYIKRIPFNYMNGIAVMWLLMNFYFNTMIAVIGIFFLMGAEYDLKEQKVSLHKKAKHLINR